MERDILKDDCLVDGVWFRRGLEFQQCHLTVI
jgi:hypothetical protein